MDGTLIAEITFGCMPSIQLPVHARRWVGHVSSLRSYCSATVDSIHASELHRLRVVCNVTVL